jgi:hypothetical protein
VVAYLAAAEVHAVRACDRTVERIAPLLPSPPPAEARRDWRSTRRVLRWATAAALTLGTLVSSSISPGTVSYWPSTWTPETAWHRVLGLVIGIGIFRLAALGALDSLRLSRLGAAIARVDLLDAEALAPFARQGLVNVLVVTGFVAVYSLFLVDLSYAGIFAVVFVPMLVTAALGLLLPMWGVRGRVREAKRAELAWCRERVRERRRRLEGRGAAEEAPLDELLAWERRVESVREWPLDASGLARLAVYLLIPLGSWSGGALVERLIDAALD